MSVREVTMYSVHCDRCDICAHHQGDPAAWSDEWQAEDDAVCGEWLATDDGKHHCPDCCEWSEDGDEIVPKPPLVAVVAP